MQRRRHYLGGLLGSGVVLGAVVAAGVLAAFFQAEPHGFASVSAAWRQVERDPDDPKAWVGLGDAQLAVDALGAAEEAYRRAIDLGHRGPAAYTRLGFLLYGKGRDVEARGLLRYARENGATDPMIDFTLAQLSSPADAREEPDSPEAALAAKTPERRAVTPERAESSDCVRPLVRAGKRGTFVVEVNIEGTDARLIVDTGASITVLERTLVDALGLRLDPDRVMRAITAAGPARLPLLAIDDLRIGTWRVPQLTVAVCDRCGGAAAEGLLGLDVQDVLGYQIDLETPRLRLPECASEP